MTTPTTTPEAIICRLCGNAASRYCGVCHEPVCDDCTGAAAVFESDHPCEDHCEDCYGGPICEEHT